jgi:hypothetical protein
LSKAEKWGLAWRTAEIFIPQKKLWKSCLVTIRITVFNSTVALYLSQIQNGPRTKEEGKACTPDESTLEEAAEN